MKGKRVLDDLKAVAAELRRNAAGDDDHVWLAAAAAADRKAEIVERDRTGKGAWVALIEALEWDPVDNCGEMSILAEARCESRPEAINLARQLLAEHAAALDANVSIEAKVISELEMADRR